MAKRAVIRLNGRTSRPIMLGERSARALVGTGKFAYADEVQSGSVPDLLISAYNKQPAEPVQEPEEVPDWTEFTEYPPEEPEVEISPRTGKPKRRYRRRETPTE